MQSALLFVRLSIEREEYISEREKERESIIRTKTDEGFDDDLSGRHLCSFENKFKVIRGRFGERRRRTKKKKDKRRKKKKMNKIGNERSFRNATKQLNKVICVLFFLK